VNHRSNPQRDSRDANFSRLARRLFQIGGEISVLYAGSKGQSAKLVLSAARMKGLHGIDIYASFCTIEEHFYRMMFNACPVSFLQQITGDAECVDECGNRRLCAAMKREI
jgi:hypothetical protein